MSETTAARRPVPETGILLTHFIVSDDIERSARFYADVLGGGEVAREGEPAMVALANSWVIINRGGPTKDKSTVALTAPSGDVVSSFMNIRQCPLASIASGSDCYSFGYLALVGPGLAGHPTRGAFMIG